MTLLAPQLNPAQQAVLDALGAERGARPTFDRDLGPQLQAGLDGGLEPLAAALDEFGLDRLWLSKHTLSAVLGCEARFLAQLDHGFDGWTIPMARGTVAHRAIELSMHVRGEPVPGELVDHALARLAAADDGLAEFIQRLDELDRADLRSAAVDQVSAFCELWPPLNPRWRPRSETKVRVELLGGRVVLSGKVDLSVGFAEGSTAGKVLVDLKTGGFAPAHLDDLRFYALVETIKLGVPPRRVATHYLESGRLVPEDVTVALLESAARRVVDAAHRWVALQRPDAEPVLKPGRPCRWCPILDGCAPGQAHIDEV